MECYVAQDQLGNENMRVTVEDSASRGRETGKKEYQPQSACHMEKSVTQCVWFEEPRDQHIWVTQTWTKEFPDESERREWKSWLKTQHSKN